jgi:hypothetical protein
VTPRVERKTRRHGAVFGDGQELTNRKTEVTMSRYAMLATPLLLVGSAGYRVKDDVR